MVQKNLQTALKESETDNYLGAESGQGSDKGCSHPTDERAPWDDEGEKDLIPHPGLWEQGFETMLRSALPSEIIWRGYVAERLSYGR